MSSTSPAVAQTAYSHSGNSWAKAEWYETWYVKQRVHPFFAETNPLEHRNLRRRISKAYSMSYILAMENYIDPSSLSSVTYVNFAPITILSSQEQKKCILAAARIGIAVTFSPISKTLKSSMVSFSQIRAIIRFVCSTPRVQKRLQEEIDIATAKCLLSQNAQYAEAQNLPYFQAVIKECLRVFPAGYQLPRVIPKGGATIDDHFFPGNSVLGINGWSLHRNKDIFGQDADEFRPERWLDGDTKFRNACYATFGFGSQACIGKNMAMLEVNKLVPTIFREFDIDICNTENPWTVVTAWVTYQSDFNVRFQSRAKLDVE